VSGIVLFAKTSKALSRLNSLLREKNFRKVYHAWVSPAPKLTESVLEHYLIHDDHIAKIVKKGCVGAKEARLCYRTLVLDEARNRSLLEIELETGRYHQIRAQLSAIGSPIIGDHKYGSKELFGDTEKIALHHAELQIIHPVTGERLNFRAPID
jgi:23S rRNA pseudouridine1911/1915/1917 synthase